MSPTEVFAAKSPPSTAGDTCSITILVSLAVSIPLSTYTGSEPRWLRWEDEGYATVPRAPDRSGAVGRLLHDTGRRGDGRLGPDLADPACERDALARDRRRGRGRGRIRSRDRATAVRGRRLPDRTGAAERADREELDARMPRADQRSPSR